ncbi:MAG: RNA polymerase sigma factor SigJ [Caldilineaceae bacterium]|nr:RNA polymerase sigma factor SigJ [Caldilineaceae bacterium]
MTVEQFDQYRPLLFSIAYRMLGVVADAEDILQEAYLRVQAHANRSSVHEVVEKPKQYLTTIVTRLCLNQLSAARTKREEYLGPWLPEPLLTEDRPELVNPVETALLHDSISLAFLVLLESLQPAERAVFLLHEVFDYKHSEIAEMLDKSTANCRQLLRRAKGYIAERRPRFTATAEHHEQLLHTFLHGVQSGDIDSFFQLLADDVNLVSDGGGEKGAALNVLRGKDAVSAFALGTYRHTPADVYYTMPLLNGQPAILAHRADGRPFFAMFLYGEAHEVQLIYVVAGRKLAALAAQLVP